MKKSIITIIVALFLAASMSYAASDNYEIDNVAVNGIFLDDEILALQLGEQLQIDTWIKGTGDRKDVRVKAWIGGYEYDDVQAETEVFEVKDGLMYRKELFLDLPRDMDVGSNDYKLHIEVYDKQGYIEETYPLFIEERRHDVDVQDVIIRPGTMIDAGRMLAVQVRLENFGKKKESDIRVEVSIPELGTTSVTWLDLLDTYESEDSAESTSFIPLNIPSDAPTGDYQLKIKVQYNRQHNEVEATRLIYVKGIEEERNLAKQKESVVSISTTTKAEVGKETQYEIAIANIADSRKSYSVEVIGADDWAEVQVRPDKFDLTPGAGSESIITVLPSKAGRYQIIISVMDGDTMIKEALVAVEVSGQEEAKELIEGLSMDVLKSRKNAILLGMIIVLLFALAITLSHGMKPHPDHC